MTMFLVLLLVTPKVFSQNVDAQSVLDMIKNSMSPEYQDQVAYNFVVQTCHSRWNPNGLALSDAFAIFKKEAVFGATLGLGSSDDFGMRAHVASRGINPFVDELLHSDGYYQGLRQCFPKSEVQRNIFTKDLLSWGALGDGIGFTAAVFAISRLGNLAVGGLNNVGTELATAALKKMGVVSAQTVAQTWAPKVITGSLLVVATYEMAPKVKSEALGIYQDYMVKRALENSSAALSEPFDESSLDQQKILYADILHQLQILDPRSLDFQEARVLQKNTRNMIIETLNKALASQKITNEQRQKFQNDLSQFLNASVTIQI